jgi:hypothetical protein
MLPHKGPLFSKMRRKGGDLGQISGPAKSLFLLKSVCPALSGTEITFFEHLGGYTDSLFQQACFIGLDVTCFMWLEGDHSS